MPLREALILFGCLVVAVILHELSHGVVALWLGDDTARRAGRLTLNPIPHLDPFGSIILPAMGALVARALYGNGGVLPGTISQSTSDVLIEIAFYFALVNLLLGLFNLIPIPPLDGSALLERVLPASWLPVWYRFRPYGLLILLLLIFFTGVIGTIVQPFFDALRHFVLA